MIHSEKPKTAGTLEAQYASYGERINSTEVFNKLAEHGLRRVAATDEEVPLGYVEHLRSLSDEEREGIRVGAAILDRYKDFAGPVGELLKSADPHELGRGNYSIVYLLATDSGKYAVRVPQKANNRFVHGRISASIAARHLPGLERVVAASYQDGVVVSEFVPGKHAMEMSPDEIDAIPSSHIDAFLETRLQAPNHGIVFDPHSQNVLYDPEGGFTDIDYTFRGQESNKISALHDVVNLFSSDTNAVMTESQGASLRAMHARIIKGLLGKISNEDRADLMRVISSQQVTNRVMGDIRF